MKNSTTPHQKPLRGIAALFDDLERKELFSKYLFFLGWIEVLILAVCWLYQMGDGGYDQLGIPIDIPFPWKAYFLVSFLAPVAITFLIGVVVVGFNKYFAEHEATGDVSEPSMGADPLDEPPSGRMEQLQRTIVWVQRLPFLALLLLLGVSAGFFYKLDDIMAFLTSVGEKSVKIFLITGAIALGLASVFALILIIMNFKLRKKSMEYQYKSEVAERFGLIILEDNTVLNSEGKLLVNGKGWKEAVPMLPAEASDSPRSEPTPAPIAVRAVDVES